MIGQPLLFFLVDGIIGALPLEQTLCMVRMVRVNFCSDRGHIIGTINFHGQMIPVCSVRSLLGHSDRAPALSDNLIIVQSGRACLAFWVDETSIVRPDEIHSAYDTPFGRLDQLSHLGISIQSDGLILIEDIRLFLYEVLFSSRSDPITYAAPVHQGRSDPSLLSPSGDSDSDQISSILTQRADELALPEETTVETPVIDVLKFTLVYREYAVEMRYVREVIMTDEITPVPGTPDHIIGICPVRGEIISLVDLRVLLSIPDLGLTDLNQVIVLTDGTMTFGILADQITGPGTIPGDMQGSTEMGYSGGQKYVEGVIGTSLTVLNAAAILADPVMLVDDTDESMSGEKTQVRRSLSGFFTGGV
ncbi:MAG TPA: chemotaxis protein CheW [Methanospirillum sp.]|nr:chemotaxis protein CheW [Methanospirillum sp.]